MTITRTLSNKCPNWAADSCWQLAGKSASIQRPFEISTRHPPPVTRHPSPATRGKDLPMYLCLTARIWASGQKKEHRNPIPKLESELYVNHTSEKKNVIKYGLTKRRRIWEFFSSSPLSWKGPESHLVSGLSWYLSPPVLLRASLFGWTWPPW